MHSVCCRDGNDHEDYNDHVVDDVDDACVDDDDDVDDLMMMVMMMLMMMMMMMGVILMAAFALSLLQKASAPEGFTPQLVH